MVKERKMKTVLTIAGSDASGGAGVQADIKTITMHGAYAMSAITAMTAQNTLGVKAVLDSTPAFLKEQLDAVFEDIYPDAVKIGMVSSTALIDAIADRLNFFAAKNIVVDPVMAATSGSSLLRKDAEKTLTEKLFPIATLVTPNIPETEILADMQIEKKEDMIKAAERIEKSCGCSVLVKGGHGTEDATDLLYTHGEVHWYYAKRIDNPNTHGTGCTLSSAIAANLAKGFALPEAVKRAKEYLSEALGAGLNLGRGAGPLMHNFGLCTKYSEENSV